MSKYQHVPGVIHQCSFYSKFWSFCSVCVYLKKSNCTRRQRPLLLLCLLWFCWQYLLCQVSSASQQNSQWKMHSLYINIIHQRTLSCVTYRPIFSGEHSFTQARQFYAFLGKKYHPTKLFWDRCLALQIIHQIYFITTPYWKNKKKSKKCGQTGTN